MPTQVHAGSTGSAEIPGAAVAAVVVPGDPVRCQGLSQRRGTRHNRARAGRKPCNVPPWVGQPSNSGRFLRRPHEWRLVTGHGLATHLFAPGGQFRGGLNFRPLAGAQPDRTSSLRQLVSYHPRRREKTTDPGASGPSFGQLSMRQAQQHGHSSPKGAVMKTGGQGAGTAAGGARASGRWPTGKGLRPLAVGGENPRREETSCYLLAAYGAGRSSGTEGVRGALRVLPAATTDGGGCSRAGEDHGGGWLPDGRFRQPGGAVDGA